MHGSIHISDAVQWDAPLSRGLVSWYLALPDQQRGNVFRDLCRRNDGTLTNGPTWTGAKGRPSGFGAIQMARASNQMVTLPAFSAAIDYPITLACWFMATTTSYFASQPLVILTNGAHHHSLQISTANGISATTRHNLVASGTATTTTTITANTWHFAAAVFASASDRRAFLDSGGKGTNTTSVSPPAMTGGTLGTGSFAFDGWIDSALIIRRALSDADISELYQESRAGYPNTLNWHRPRGYAAQVAAATSPFFYQRYIAGRAA